MSKMDWYVLGNIRFEIDTHDSISQHYLHLICSTLVQCKIYEVHNDTITSPFVPLYPTNNAHYDVLVSNFFPIHCCFVPNTSLVLLK